MRTDVYGLGALLYSILTSRPPFQGPTAESLLVQLSEADPLPPRRLNPSVPRDLETITLKCLAREPERRYGTAQAVAEDLAAFLEGRPISARPVSGWEKAWRWCRRRPALAGALAFAVLALLSGTVVSLALAREARISEAGALVSAEETRQALYSSTLLRVQEDLRTGNPLTAEALSRLIPKDGQRDLRGWEWHYLESLPASGHPADPGSANRGAARRRLFTRRKTAGHFHLCRSPGACQNRPDPGCTDLCRGKNPHGI